MTSSLLNIPAITCFVISSIVIPSPPDVITNSTSLSEFLTKNSISSLSSPTAIIRLTVIPISVSFSAIYAELVSTISPEITSSPIIIISATPVLRDFTFCAGDLFIKVNPEIAAVATVPDARKLRRFILFSVILGAPFHRIVGLFKKFHLNKEIKPNEKDEQIYS